MISNNKRNGYKQTEIGLIPEDWVVKNVFQLAENRKELFDDGDWIEAEHITNHGVRLIQTGNIGIGKFVDKAARKYVFESSFIKLGCKELVHGDLLICRLAEPAGRACVFPDIHEEKVITSVDVTIFRPSEKLADRTFLSNMFSTDGWFKDIEEMCGGTTHKRISRSALGRIKVAMPSIGEQRAIASALCDVDHLIATLDKLIAKKRDIKSGAMQQLLTGKKRLPGFKGEWAKHELGELTEMRSGGTPLSTVTAYYGGDIPWVSISDMTRGGKVIFGTDKYLTKTGFANSSTQMFPVGTVLYAMYASLGECSIAGVPLCTSQAILGISVKEKLSNEFLYYYLTSLRGYVKTLGQQGTQANLNKGMVQSFELLVPPISEQTAIATVLLDMDAELASLEARREKSHALKQGMMQQLLTGKIRLV